MATAPHLPFLSRSIRLLLAPLSPGHPFLVGYIVVSKSPQMPKALPNYYEFLQVSSLAETETIQRVYHFLAKRYHPDHPGTGNIEKFSLLTEAWNVLSDSDRRAAYDTALAREASSQNPLSDSVDFMDDLDGEKNRRLAVLAMLYARRRSHPDRPSLSLHEVESGMGFPREYLDFALWYLARKGYISRADNADFTLTVDGVDFVESERPHLPLLQKMLTSGPIREPAAPASGSTNPDKASLLTPPFK